MRFTKGFEYMRKPYGVHGGRLYKLPHKHPNMNRWYNLLQCPFYTVNGKVKGFQLGNHRLSFARIETMLEDIDVTVEVYDEESMPF